jgi:DNA-binding transcriptional LysR family regulator
MFNPLWLKTFVTVAAAPSFTEAGRRLELTQSTVSDHIRRLEQAVGRRLFVRDTHAHALTGDGEMLLVHARLILEAHERAELQFSGPRLRGRVRFGTSDDLVLGPLPEVLAAFRRLHPDVELDMTIGVTAKLYELLDGGALDIIVGKKRPGDTRGQKMHEEALIWRAKEGLQIEADEPMPLILLSEPSVTRSLVLDAMARLGRPFQIVCNSSSYVGCAAAARAGLGVTVQPANLLTPGLVAFRSEALPRLPNVEFVAVAARALSVPAKTMLQILLASDLGSKVAEIRRA